MVRTLDQTKRAAILKAARNILIRDGYAASKMSDIAGEAGVAPGTLYLYFDSKESLASAIGEDCLNRVNSQFGKIIKKLDSPDGVDSLLDWALRIGTQERDVLAMLKQSKPDGKSPPQARERFVEQLVENLEAFMARGLIRKYDDTSSLADVVLAVIHRIIMSCPMYQDTDPERIKAAAATVLRHALFDDATLERSHLNSAKQS